MLRQFKPYLTANINRKGVLDIDTVKGCKYGTSEYPDGGCYGICYAYKTARMRGFDFSSAISRNHIMSSNAIKNAIKKTKNRWFRIGTMGDPCHDWEFTVDICGWLGRIKTPVIVTKHWTTLSDKQLFRLKRINAIINTSISALDNYKEIKHRLYQFNRIKSFGIKSVLRIVSVNFGTAFDRMINIQNELFLNKPIIDNPLRIPKSDKRVKEGYILTQKYYDINSFTYISLLNKGAYIGKCNSCSDQCGVCL